MIEPAAAAVHSIETRTHGRILVHAPATAGPWPVLVGFHGYAENAETHLQALSAIPGVQSWLLVAVQALHPFYARQSRIVASWMTSQDREQAIEDNVEYVAHVVAHLRTQYATGAPLVFSGFSQGGAMAYRAAARLGADGVLILAADVPPDVATAPDVALPPILIGRGTRDEWYTEEKHADDLKTLERLGAVVDSCVFDGGHEWTNVFYSAAGSFLSRLRQRV